MTTNHQNPTILTIYTDVLDLIHARINDIARGLDPSTTDYISSTLPANTILWDSQGSKWKKILTPGQPAVDLAASYAISITGNAATANKLQSAVTINGTSFDGSQAITITANTGQSLTFNNSGSGVATGTTFNGSSAKIISYNSIGAPSTTGAGASGSWGISITGNSATSSTSSAITISSSSTNATYYPVFTTSGGDGKPVYISTAKFTLNPGTGDFAISGGLSGATITTSSSASIGGAITAGGDITAFYSSDVNLKTNILKIDNALEKISKLSGVTFNWNDLAIDKPQDIREAGVLAQQVEEVLPEVVVTRPNGYKAVQYEKLIPLLIEGIKELNYLLLEINSTK